MSIVVLKLPDVKVENERWPHHYPYCKHEVLQRWGGSLKRVRDHEVKRARVYRYHCTGCRRTFRHYPVGVTGRSKASAYASWRPCAGRWGLVIGQWRARWPSLGLGSPAGRAGTGRTAAPETEPATGVHRLYRRKGSPQSTALAGRAGQAVGGERDHHG